MENSGSYIGSYPFKRNIYYEIEKAVDKSCVVFLLGPRKCGKTVALLQFEGSRDNVKYYNFKTLSQNESMELFDDIRNAMREDKDTVFLLDEITYAFLPEREINEVAVLLSGNPCSNTRVVFTGSQSVALETWASRAFCGNAAFVRADFMNYGEWLQYRGMNETTEDVYNQFLCEIDKFYGFVSMEEYLRGCLEETVVSNQKTDNVIIGNDTYLLDVETLIDICYATLFTLHNHVTSHGFAKKDKLNDAVRFYFKEVCSMLGDDEIGERIEDSFVGRYNNFRTRDLETLKQAFLFLHRTGLITITPVSDDVENVPNILRDLMSKESKVNYKDELFNSYNICIKYPMFYIGILKDILGDMFPERLPQALIGSIVECNVRGILPERGAFEFKDAYKNEVDYVNVVDRLALEITISNKKSNEMNFRYLPEDYKKVILTKDVAGSFGDRQYIPYHEFIRNVTEAGRKKHWIKNGNLSGTENDGFKENNEKTEQTLSFQKKKGR